MQADMPPRFDNLAQVERIDSSSPSLVFGFQAYGEEGDLQRLEKALKAARIEFQRFDYHTKSVVVSPPYSVAASMVTNMWKKAAAGEFGTLRVDILLVDKDAAADGVEIDELEVVRPDEIRR